MKNKNQRTEKEKDEGTTQSPQGELSQWKVRHCHPKLFLYQHVPDEYASYLVHCCLLFVSLPGLINRLDRFAGQHAPDCPTVERARNFQDRPHAQPRRRFHGKLQVMYTCIRVGWWFVSDMSKNFTTIKPKDIINTCIKEIPISTMLCYMKLCKCWTRIINTKARRREEFLLLVKLFTVLFIWTPFVFTETKMKDKRYGNGPEPTVDRTVQVGPPDHPRSEEHDYWAGRGQGTVDRIASRVVLYFLKIIYIPSDPTFVSPPLLLLVHMQLRSLLVAAYASPSYMHGRCYIERWAGLCPGPSRTLLASWCFHLREHIRRRLQV